MEGVSMELQCILGHGQPAQGDEGLGGVKGYWILENSPGGASIVYSYLFFWLFALGLWPINRAAIPDIPARKVQSIIVSPPWMSQKWKMCLVSERGQTRAWIFITCTATRWRRPIHQRELSCWSQTFPIKTPRQCCTPSSPPALALWKQEVHLH